MESLSIKQQLIQMAEQVNDLEKRITELAEKQVQIIAELKRVNNKLKTLEK